LALARSGRDFRIECASVNVRFGDRSFAVPLTDVDDPHILSPAVAKSRGSRVIDVVSMRAWLRNRATMLVRFRPDGA